MNRALGLVTEEKALVEITISKSAFFSPADHRATSAENRFGSATNCGAAATNRSWRTDDCATFATDCATFAGSRTMPATNRSRLARNGAASEDDGFVYADRGLMPAEKRSVLPRKAEGSQPKQGEFCPLKRADRLKPILFSRCAVVEDSKKPLGRPHDSENCNEEIPF